MIRRLATPALVLIALASLSCSSSGGDPAMTQEKFGVRMAKMNLWREAMFRFQRAVEINPEDAMAHSNLAVALEANGDFDGAAKAYREALRLDKSNQFIQKNYSRFVEFTTRDRRRQQRRPSGAAPAVTPAASEATPPAATPEQPSKPVAVTAGEPAAGPPDTAEPVQSDPAPTAAAPAATPAPNPAQPPTPPPQSNTPPGGQS